MRRLEDITGARLIVGLEVHVELATRSKLFSRVPNPAAPSKSRSSAAGGATTDDPGTAGANTLVDPVILGLPGALPVLNREAVELSMLVGLALGCRVAGDDSAGGVSGEVTRWDRKSYFYPDLPKNYQISQYDLPLCADGAVELPPLGPDGEIDYEAVVAGSGQRKRIGIIRAHLEEDAGKLMHEEPGGGGGGSVGGGRALDYSIVDFDRAGTPLLEIVTQPDFASSGEVVAFCQWLRDACRFLGASEGVLQKGHMRFEPNINMELTLKDGRLVRTPVVEVKNLNSFRAVKGAIEFEAREQPARWVADGREFGPATKSTRGWDDARGVAGETFVQRDKEDAQDYRYFPDPDIPAVRIDAAWRERVRARLVELPLERLRRYVGEYGLGVKEARALVEERADCDLFERATDAAAGAGVDRVKAAKGAANIILQSGQKRGNEQTARRTRAAEEMGISGALVAPVLVSELGVSAAQIGAIVAMREHGSLSAARADELFGLLAASSDPAADARAVAQDRGLLTVRDAAAMEKWCDEAIAQNPQSAADVRAGKTQAIGRLVGAVMKLSAGGADAAEARRVLIEKLGAK